jgi:hypothetical protein
MHRRLNQEIVSLLAEHNALSEREGDGRDLVEPQSLLRTRLVATIAAGLCPAASAGEDETDADQYRACIAAYLDGAVTERERIRVTKLLVDDPVARAEQTSAVTLLREIEIKAVPEPLLARATKTFALAPPIAPDAPIQRRPSWLLGRTALWSGVAVLFVVAAIPVVLSAISNDKGPVQDNTALVRGIFPTTPEKTPVERATGNPETQSCRDTNDRLKAGQGRDSSMKTDKPDNRVAEQSGERPVNDPCQPKPVPTEGVNVDR